MKRVPYLKAHISNEQWKHLHFN